jgi:hypothetical protein
MQCITIVHSPYEEKVDEKYFDGRHTNECMCCIKDAADLQGQ